MLKKVIIGFLCFIILAVTAAGIYVYTLDWNKHKTVVADRFSQIMGLKAVIEGNLKVELFPTPKFSANKVKFSKNAGGNTPLIVVNEISANVDLAALFSSKFILSAMTLTGATVNVNIDDKGVSNWEGVGTNSKNKSGNIEVSFNDVRLTSSTFSYKNLKEKEEFSIPNISASISAPSLKGPYKTDGKFIHNNSEVKFRGNIIKDKNIAINLAVENAATGAKATLEGNLGEKAQGNVTFDAPNLVDTAAVAFGDGKVNEHYEGSLYFSFKYDHDKETTHLDNVNIAFGNKTKGTGTILLTAKKDKTDVVANMDMSIFDLSLLEYICSDMVSFSKAGNKFTETDLAKYAVSLNLKSGKAYYNGAEIQDLIFVADLENNQINLSRFGAIFPGNTSIKSAGTVDLTNGVNYNFNQNVETSDLRAFASVFGIDLSKYASTENKKTIFKKAQADKIALSGNLGQLKVAVPNATIDATNFFGEFGFIFSEEKTAVVADVKAEKILFDRYVQVLPSEMKQASFKDKVLYQLNLIPLDHTLDIDARFSLNTGVYNQLPVENMLLEFKLNKERLDITKFFVQNLSGADVNLSLSADNIYNNPYFKELSYDVKTNQFVKFAEAVGLDLGDKPIFKRDVFASQGALSGSFDDFSLSCVQKFGDTEFSYTGTVKNTKDEALISGDIELKSDNFLKFVKALNLDYKPDLPVTSFTLNGKIKGSSDDFTITDINAYLGANAIKGDLLFAHREEIPNLSANLSFDKFDIDRMFNLGNKSLFYTSGTEAHTFIAKPDIYEEKIDYSSLKNLEFDVRATAKQLVYKNKFYKDAKISTILNKGKLNVNEFKAQTDDSSIELTFVLDSNNMPSIEGNFAIKGISLPVLGGSVYALEGGLFDADGSFKTSAVSQKAFLENLNSHGKFQVLGTAVKGWDLDIIKFELEQRNSVTGFEESVLNNLRNGHSSFSKIQGKYDISKGLLVSENSLWDSPVVNINMKLDLNFNSWLFNAVFSAVYNHASFSDVLKFTFDGNLANPEVKADLQESIARISETENLIQTAKAKEEKAQRAKLSGKITELQSEINRVLQSISQLSLDVAQYKPVTNNSNVTKIYDTSVKTVHDAEKALNQMLSSLKNNPDEKQLMGIEADLSAEKSKLSFISKTLEDNFVVDSKYIFDDTFNKIAWVYNVAQNNASYYSSLTEAYMEQIYMMDSSDSPIPQEKQEELSDDIQSVMLEMDKITALHNKIRENYLAVIDTSKVSEMKKNNDVANKALDTILSSTEYMNKKIVDSIDKFSVVLDIQSRDYDDYMVYPPNNPQDIDVSQPTIHLDAASPDNKSASSTPKEDKESSGAQSSPNPDGNNKAESLSLNLQEPKNGLFSLINKIKQASVDDILSPNLHFAGLSNLIHEASHKQQSNLNKEQPSQEEHGLVQPTVVASAEENMKAPLPDVEEDVKDTFPNVKEKVEATAPVVEAKPIVESDDTSIKISQPLIKGASAIAKVADETINENLLQSGSEKEIKDNPHDTFLADIETIRKDNRPTTDVAKEITKDADKNLIANTQIAMDEILKNIKKTEADYQLLLAEHQKNNDKPASLETIPDVSADSIISAENNVTPSPKEQEIQKLKTNPVIALDIGKSVQNHSEQQIALDLSKKSKFKVKEDTSIKIANETKNSLRNQASNEVVPTPKKVADNIVAASLTDDKNKILPDTEIKNLRKDVLRSMLANETSKEVTLSRAHKVTDEAPVYIDDAQNKQQGTHYLFATSYYAPNVASGTVAKKINVAKIHSSTLSIPETKYLFASTDGYLPIVSGSVNKNTSLYVQ